MIDRTHPQIYDYFDKFAEKNQALVRQYLERFPFHKSYVKKNVLDFGSGTGCLCFQIYEKCGMITGLDIDPILYNYSQLRLSRASKSQQEKISFLNKRIEDLESSSYDLIFSKDVFEHVHDTEVLLEEMYRVLKPGGECLIGFGPLWGSPFGDHGIVRSAFGFTIPWMHLMLGKKNMVRAFNSSLLHQTKFSKQKITDLSSYLNFKTGEYFRDLIHSSKFDIIWYDENIHENSFVNIFKKFMINGRFSKYFIRNIYCVLKKPEN